MTRKSRVSHAFIHIFRGRTISDGDYNVYFATVPYDKKGRKIPSSVDCCYNSLYFDPDQVNLITKAL